ncbi:MAG: type II toxin-antitoxin system HicA family toxin [Deltaproteobacteria bacterium]|nr:type II toxin-antitoxin system HicA family toxin [Deltaproteobacteria bacterium]
MPRVAGTVARGTLERLGLERVRQRGSHVVLRKGPPDAVVGCVVPLHDEFAVGTLAGILRQAGVSAEEFVANR